MVILFYAEKNIIFVIHGLTDCTQKVRILNFSDDLGMRMKTLNNNFGNC